jgi:hypothetical protein
MRKAELIMGIVMGVLSIAVMVKSAELPIGWEPDAGPGGGAFPFWLATGMLLCCIWVVVKWVRRTSPQSVSEEPYMDRQTLVLFALAAGSLTAMIGLIHVIGVYFAVPLFLVFYMRVIGQHSWRVTGLLAISVPVITFFFFEGALTITLPKGYSEPLFYPLYDLIY